MPHLNQRQLSPEIQELTDTVIAAANGKPLKTSITAEKEKEKIAESFIRQFILKMMDGGTVKTEESSEPKKEETA